MRLFKKAKPLIDFKTDRDARFRINRACWKVGQPWVDAGIGLLNGQARVFRPGHGACYECSFTAQDYKLLKAALPCPQLASRYASEGKVPTTPTIASIVAAVQVQEALKLLSPDSWDGRMLVSREFIFNGTVCETGIVAIAEREDCRAHQERIGPDSLVELPSAKAAETTGTELLAKARELLDPTATISLGFDLVVEKRCPACGAASPVLRPDAGLFREDLKCDHCGHECAMEECRDHVWGLEREHKLGGPPGDYGVNILDRPLAEIGVPPLDILTARGADGRVLYLELSGDAEDLLKPNA